MKMIRALYARLLKPDQREQGKAEEQYDDRRVNVNMDQSCWKKNMAEFADTTAVAT